MSMGEHPPHTGQHHEQQRPEQSDVQVLPPPLPRQPVSLETPTAQEQDQNRNQNHDAPRRKIQSRLPFPSSNRRKVFQRSIRDMNQYESEHHFEHGRNAFVHEIDVVNLLARWRGHSFPQTPPSARPWHNPPPLHQSVLVGRAGFTPTPRSGPTRRPRIMHEITSTPLLPPPARSLLWLRLRAMSWRNCPSSHPS